MLSSGSLFSSWKGWHYNRGSGGKAMAHRFTVIFEKEEEGGYHVFCPTLPGCHTQSETIDEGVKNIREAIELYVESLTEDGLPIPIEDIFIKPIEILA
jgi:predicted RNase H-like HicB family nuclease